MNKINSACVYCASSTKIDSFYFDAARELGALLGQRQIRLINGAGNMGLMSACLLYTSEHRFSSEQQSKGNFNRRTTPGTCPHRGAEGGKPQ